TFERCRIETEGSGSSAVAGDFSFCFRWAGLGGNRIYFPALFFHAELFWQSTDVENTWWWNTTATGGYGHIRCVLYFLWPYDCDDVRTQCDLGDFSFEEKEEVILIGGLSNQLPSSSVWNGPGGVDDYSAAT